MNLFLITAPTVEPIDAVDAKEHLLVDTDAADIYIEGLIKAARQQVEETECGIQLLTATYELKLDAFSDPIMIPRPPFGALISIKYIDTAGDEITLSDTSSSPVVTSSVFAVDAKSVHAPDFAEIYLAFSQSWPSTRAERNAVRIRFTCGFGAAAAVPEALKQWMLIMVSTMYEHREREITGLMVSQMRYVDGLLDPYRAKRYA